MKIRPFILGFRDGFREPYYLSMGITWEHDQDANEAYDTGVNWGQRIRSPRNRQGSDGP